MTIHALFRRCSVGCRHYFPRCLSSVLGRGLLRLTEHSWSRSTPLFPFSFRCAFSSILWRWYSPQSAVLSKLLYTFYSSGNGLNHNLHVVFYVGFRNFRKTNTENQSVKITRPIPTRMSLFCWVFVGGYWKICSFCSWWAERLVKTFWKIRSVMLSLNWKPEKF